MIYEIWTEGYAATGQRSGAMFHGTVDARSFDEACIRKLGKSLDKDNESPDGYRRIDGRLSVWGCRCFEFEVDARKSFG